MQVYLDNAATTRLDPEVFEAMQPYMREHYGNPSSVHTQGRATRSAVEKSRRRVADLLHASPGEIFFTSGGTEADNTAIRCSIEAYNLTHAITSPLEHHAVLHTLQEMERRGQIALSYVQTDARGNIDLTHLEALLKTNKQSLVSLMHGNNEIGNLTDIQAVGELCQAYDAVFHSDTVQTMAHYPHDLSQLKVHCLAGAAHKFHGPKGVGILYIKKGHKISPLLYGGSQERNMRGGTENLYGIVGMAKALEMGYAHMDDHRKHITALKQRMIAGLEANIPDVRFHGTSAYLDQSLYTVLNVSFPASADNDMLLFNLDLHKISASGGSACSSGAALGSHVLSALNVDKDRGAVRFSFSKYNTEAEIDYVLDKVSHMYAVKV